ncbi:Crp/Fnr family transcriptional regulator [Mucilaginibacter sabulilitoris]|uniref:Crp/Fnr family transcriptional regulator n=1 Tax=Mucilaginibacter sabulilitoris TaxID=1173583 RepID=A0ABZ0THA7_9SPHI|nr:Crp/Fnr family transcriptional regulator [Mucilaginibacter sabulilitoris]WPU92564.1 Crp/Fnr family transcriptional regulator [Mucilaginibacter sabulilitoris]
MKNNPLLTQPTVPSAWKKYRHLWKYEDVPAKHLLLKEGDICRKVILIEKGSLRTWFNHDGREISFQFYFEGDAVSSPESFYKHTPSQFSIETLEPTRLRWLDTRDMEIIIKDPVILHFMMNHANERRTEFMRHFFSYLKDSPTQRYENLLREKPEVIKRVPLQHIATYLGITQVSLSRIRNKIR